jgi:hypothetical protein
VPRSGRFRLFGTMTTSEIMPWAFPRKVYRGERLAEGGEEANTMAGAECTARLPSTPVFLRAFPLKDDSASAPQDQHNLI